MQPLIGGFVDAEGVLGTGTASWSSVRRFVRREEGGCKAALEGCVQLRPPTLETVPIRPVAAAVVFRGRTSEAGEEVVGGRGYPAPRFDGERHAGAAAGSWVFRFLFLLGFG